MHLKLQTYSKLQGSRRTHSYTCSQCSLRNTLSICCAQRWIQNDLSSASFEKALRVGKGGVALSSLDPPLTALSPFLLTITSERQFSMGSSRTYWIEGFWSPFAPTTPSVSDYQFRTHCGLPEKQSDIRFSYIFLRRRESLLYSWSVRNWKSRNPVLCVVVGRRFQ